jgi:hypothetical protein
MNSAAPLPRVSNANEPARNAFYIEGLGPGLWYSINYERLLTSALGARVGLSYWSSTYHTSGEENSLVYWTLPITFSFIGVRSGRNCLEIGAGATLAASPFGDLLLGYRSQPLGKGGYQIRIGVAALVGKGLIDRTLSSNSNTVRVLPWGYLSLGGWPEQ